MKRISICLAVLNVVVMAAVGASAAQASSWEEGSPGFICSDNGTSYYVADQAAALEQFPDATAGRCPDVSPPVIVDEPGHTFLCMSHFGGVPVAFEWADVPHELSVGWFVPSATLGNNDAWDNVGGYHLICNTDGLHATGTGLNGSGGDAADVQDVAAWKVTLAEYGPLHVNHFALYTAAS